MIDPLQTLPQEQPVAISQPLESGQPRFPDWTLADVALIIVGAGLIFAIGLFFTVLVFHYAGGEMGSHQMMLYSSTLAALEALALCSSFYLLGLRRRGWQADTVGLGRLPTGWLWAALGLGLLAIPVSGLVALGTQYLLGLPLGDNPQLQFLAPEGFSYFGLTVMLLLAGLAAPLGEELIFRSLLYPWMRARWGIWPALLISSLIFGALHFEPAIAAAAAVLGLLLGWVYEKSSSLWPSFIIHAFNNSAKVILLYLLLAKGVL